MPTVRLGSTSVVMAIVMPTSSGRSLLPGFIEFAVHEICAERLLFGSDTPIYHVAMQRTRIETADIPF